jgi:CheY-like chemotaxis protein
MEPPSPSGKGSSETPRPKRRVVVADDNVYLARTLKMVLELWGFDATVVHDGNAALATLLAGGNAAALLDIRLPRLSGLEVARELQSRPDVRPVQLIAMTGSLASEDRASSLEAGFDHHLIKPVDPNLLRSLLGDP